MPDTLAALHAAVIDAPTDRTVRLVYADALDENGDPSDAARARFIRAQIALEGTSDDDPARPALVERCQELFASNWIDWWRPVCVALGLPEPHVPGRGLGSRVKRFVGRDTRETGAPYIAYPDAFSLRSEEHGFTAQFYAGFPEMLAIHQLTAQNLMRLDRNWFAAAPFCRLRLAESLPEWVANVMRKLSLDNVSELVFDRLLDEYTARLTALPNLRRVTTLKARPLGSHSAVRSLVHNPTWVGLRSLTLNGITPPDALRELAEHSTLEHLEELAFAIGEVPEELPLAGTVPEIIYDALMRSLTDNPRPRGPIRGPNYWPAFDALARSPVLPRLRRLRVVDADPSWIERLPRVDGGRRDIGFLFEPFLSDACVFAVADALDPDKLERLELPWTRISLACREELSRRFGSRFVAVR